MSLVYNYQEIIFKRPQSVHYWRQADCASLALNYYQNGMDFLNPQTHNLTSANGTSGNASPSETPLLYYTAAALYHLFGYHEYIYRLLNTLLFFTGLYYLFRLFSNVLKSQFWSTVLPLLFFTSPVLVYYGNNFLSNTTALSMVMIGWYHFHSYYKDRKPRSFYMAMVFFFLAGCFKITGLLSLFALLGLFVWERIPALNTQSSGKIFTSGWKSLLPFLGIFGIIGLWTWYSIGYNAQYDSKYFSTVAFPIWDMDREAIQYVIDKVTGLWMTQYFHGIVLGFLSILMVFMVVFNKDHDRLWVRTSLLLIAGTVAYVLLQFYTLGDHDYYTINLYILPVIILLGSADYMVKKRVAWMKSIGVRAAFLGLLAVSVLHAKAKVDERYQGWWNEYEMKKDLHEITPYLRSIGISSSDRVISIPDPSHLTLYLMNQTGWTEYKDMRLHQEEPYHYNSDEESIRQCVDNGARYLVLNGINQLIEKPYLKYFAQNLIGTYNNVLVFDLVNMEPNFTLKKRVVKERMFFDVENHLNYLDSFRSNLGISILDENLQITDELAYSGQLSAELNTKNPFGFTVLFKEVHYGESFTIRVQRRMDAKNKAGIVAASPTLNTFYYQDYKVLPSQKEDWEKLEMNVFIDRSMDGHELKVYVYNPGESPTYFDDMEILWYLPFEYEVIQPNRP